MGKLQEMKQKAEEVKSRLESTVLETEAAGGDIRVILTAARRIRSVRIAPALQHGDLATLEESLVAAMNKAIEAADRVNEEEMKKAAGGLLPGM